MAIDTTEKRRCVGGNMPTPDGDISSYWDRRQIAGNYRGTPIAMSLTGGSTPTGGLTKRLSLHKSLSGVATPTGAMTKKIHLHLSLAGTGTSSGAMSKLVRKFLSGIGYSSGVVSGKNPFWMVFDQSLTWRGDWAIGTTYDELDVVLYQDGDNVHAFVSKHGHNTGNLPTDRAYWSRLTQTNWINKV